MAGTVPLRTLAGTVPHGARILILAVALAGLARPALSAASPASGTPARAILAKGPDASRGLPFFSANAIPSLRVEYLIVPAGAIPANAAEAVAPGRADPVVRVWYTRERLVLGATWKVVELGGRRARLLERVEGPVIALISERYALLFELPADSPSLRGFATTLERRFAIFFDNAPTDAELSFPAIVDLPR